MTDKIAQFALQVIIVVLNGQFYFLLAARRRDFILEIKQLFDRGFGEGECSQNYFFFCFIESSFNHIGKNFSVSFQSGKNHVNFAGLPLFIGRVENVIAIQITDTDRGGRSLPRNIRNHQGGGNAQQTDDIGFVFGIPRKDGGDGLHFVFQSVIKQRADGAVNLTRVANGLIAGAGFPPDITRSLDLASGIIFFFIIHHQRKKSHIGFFFF